MGYLHTLQTPSHKMLVHCAWDSNGSFSSKGFTVEKPGKHWSRGQRASHQSRDRLKSCTPGSRLLQSNAWNIPAEESNLNLVMRDTRQSSTEAYATGNGPAIFESIKHMKGGAALLQPGLRGGPWETSNWIPGSKGLYWVIFRNP